MPRRAGERAVVEARMNRRAALQHGAIAAAGLAGAWLAACGGGGGGGERQPSGGGAPSAAGVAAPQAPRRGGTLNYRINADPPSLNLWVESTYIVAGSIAPVYNQLVQLDPMDESKVLPDLAKSWEYTNPDKTEIVFKLQDGAIAFHDGKPFTAEDVKATYEWLSSPPKGTTSPRTTAARNIGSIEVVDPKTVKFKLKGPSASFVNGLANHHHAMGAKHIVTQTNTLLDGQQQPIGTGPFVFKGYKRNNVIDLERHKGYFRQDRPYLDAVTVFIVQEDTTAVTNFLSGQLSILPGVRIADVARVEKELGARGALSIGPSLSRSALIPNGTRPPFNDPRMREAISAALDREEYNKIRQEGRGFLGSYNNPKGVWGLPAADLAKFTGYNGKPDLQKAKQLMTAAGFPDGFKGKMPVRQDFEENAVTLQPMLKKAGFDMTIEVEKSAVLNQRAINTEFDILCHTWSTPLDDPDDSFAEMVIHPDRAGRNWSKVITPELDRLFDLQRVEFDLQKRVKLVNDTDKAGVGNYPNIVVQYEARIGALYTTVKDYVFHIAPYTNHRFESVWLAK
ncbi:MAG: ABC transporter substrate-binding protein [Dehalococcoidia bacterium]